MKTKFILALSVITVLAGGTAFAQTAYYVQSVRARVMARASFKSPVLGQVSKGIKLVPTGREGTWVKVRFNNREGFISSLVIAPHPPYARIGLIKEGDPEIKQGVRRRASSYTSAAAARGLAQEDRKRISSDEKADFEALEKMEAVQVRPDELNRFLAGRNP